VRSIQRTLRQLVQGDTREELHVRTLSGAALRAVVEDSPTTPDGFVTALTSVFISSGFEEEVPTSTKISSTSLKNIISDITVVGPDGFFIIDDIGLSPSMARAKPAANLITTLNRVMSVTDDGDILINTMSGQALLAMSESGAATISDLVDFLEVFLSVPTTTEGVITKFPGTAASSTLAIARQIVKTDFSDDAYFIDDIGISEEDVFSIKDKKIYDIFTKLCTGGFLRTASGQAIINMIKLGSVDIDDITEDIII